MEVVYLMRWIDCRWKLQRVDIAIVQAGDDLQMMVVPINIGISMKGGEFVQLGNHGDKAIDVL
jgi:hypothetical protein